MVLVFLENTLVLNVIFLTKSVLLPCQTWLFPVPISTLEVDSN